jgi:hypothetical protein
MDPMLLVMISSTSAAGADADPTLWTRPDRREERPSEQAAAEHPAATEAISRGTARRTDSVALTQQDFEVAARLGQGAVAQARPLEPPVGVPPQTLNRYDAILGALRTEALRRDAAAAARGTGSITWTR